MFVSFAGITDANIFGRFTRAVIDLNGTSRGEHRFVPKIEGLPAVARVIKTDTVIVNFDFEKPLQIGITGGIGSGKSLVCAIFSRCCVPVYDADSRAKP